MTASVSIPMRPYLSALVAVIVATLALAAGVEATTSGAGRHTNVGSADAMGARSTQPLRIYRRAKVSLRYPSSWHIKTRRLDQVIDPHTLLVVSSYVVPQGPRDTTHVPGYARGLPANGVFILLSEVLDGASLKRSLPRLHSRPPHFTLPTQGSSGCRRCSSTTFQFRAESRAFYLYVTIGPKASARTRVAAQAILDSLAISRNAKSRVRAQEQSLRVSGSPLQLVSGRGLLWVLTCDRRCTGEARASIGRVVRIEPRTGRVTGSATVDRPQAIAVGREGVFGLDFWRGYVYRLDPSSPRVTGRLRLVLPFSLGKHDDHAFLPETVSLGEGSVWVTTNRGVVARIDPQHLRLVKMVRIEPAALDSVAAGRGFAWAAGELDGVSRI